MAAAKVGASGVEESSLAQAQVTQVPPSPP